MREDVALEIFRPDDLSSANPPHDGCGFIEGCEDLFTPACLTAPPVLIGIQNVKLFSRDSQLVDILCIWPGRHRVRYAANSVDILGIHICVGCNITISRIIVSRPPVASISRIGPLDTRWRAIDNLHCADPSTLQALLIFVLR